MNLVITMNEHVIDSCVLQLLVLIQMYFELGKPTVQNDFDGLVCLRISGPWIWATKVVSKISL